MTLPPMARRGAGARAGRVDGGHGAQAGGVGGRARERRRLRARGRRRFRPRHQGRAPARRGARDGGASPTFMGLVASFSLDIGIFCDFLCRVFLLSAILVPDLLGLARSRPQVLRPGQPERGGRLLYRAHGPPGDHASHDALRRRRRRRRQPGRGQRWPRAVLSFIHPSS